MMFYIEMKIIFDENTPECFNKKYCFLKTRGEDKEIPGIS